MQIAVFARRAALVDRFIKTVSAEHDALLVCNNAKSTRLIWQMKAVLDELKSLQGDQRGALLPLLSSQEIGVKYRAAQAVLALEPEPARRAIESVSNSNIQPEVAEAVSTLSALENGTFVPT